MRDIIPEYEDELTQDEIAALESIDDGLDEVLDGLGGHFASPMPTS